MQLPNQTHSTHDSQRSRAYEAEQSLPEFTMALAGESVIRARIRAVLNSRRVARNFPFMRAVGARDISVTFNARRWCRGGRSGLQFTTDADESELLVLHEIAHMIHAREQDSLRRMVPHVAIPFEWRHRKGYAQGHGWRWAMTYLQLVLWFMGRDVHDRLKAAFKAHRVRHRPPRVMSPEQRAAAAARLAKLRPKAEFARRLAA